MGTTVSLSSSPEPESGTPSERIACILAQRPLLMAPMLRLSRILNDSSAAEKRKIDKEIGFVVKVCEMIHEFSPETSLPSHSRSRRTTHQQSKRRASSSLPNIKGVGFGFGTTKSRWDMEKAVEQRMAKEEYLIWLLNALSSFLYCASPDFSDPEAIWDKTHNTAHPHLTEETCSKLAGSAIIPLIDYHLRNDSIFDVSEHMEFYQALFEISCSFALFPMLIPPLLELEGGTSIIADLIPKFRETITFYLKSPKGQVTSPDFRLIDFIHKIQQWSDLLEYMAGKYRPHSATQQEAVIRSAPLSSSSDKSPIAEEDEEPAACAVLDRETHYINMLKPYKVTTWKFFGDYGKLVVGYAFKKEAKNLNPFSPSMKDRTKRIAKELASFQASLPLSSSNSIFVCVDESRCDIMKVLIIGPEDTPYQNGAFEFDIFFPASYPYSPPKVSFLTTGGQTVRFNPNLYADGKVCLSILGTWEGRPEEKWNPYCSLLQILISIQGLIFVKEPYFNEPGFERHMGTSKGRDYSSKYNIQIEHATLHYAVKGQLKDPPPYFEAVITRHFWLKRGQILEQAKRWREAVQQEVHASTTTTAAATKGSSQNSTTADLFEINSATLKAMEKTVEQLTDEFLHMSPPQ